MNASTKPKSASASVNAMPRNIVVRTMPADLGLARHRGDGVADHDADADARADGGAAVHDASTDGLETGLELTGLLDCEEQSKDLTQHLSSFAGS